MDVSPQFNITYINFEDAETRCPSMSDFKTRFTSYHDWKHFDIQQPHTLTTAGFMCRDAAAGLVECYHCGLLLNHWKRTDSPKVEHIRHRPDCGFVKHKYNKETVAYFSNEHNAQLVKEEDFMNIDGRPTFNQYLLWVNYVSRMGVQFSDHNPDDLMKWRIARKRLAWVDGLAAHRCL